MIPYGKQSIDRKDIEAVIDVLKSDFITQGTQVPKFEDIVSNYVNSKFSVAVNSGTSALHIACLALGLKPGDTVWTVPNTFVASANCALYCGAKVDFVDIHNSSFNIDISALESKLKNSNFSLLSLFCLEKIIEIVASELFSLSNILQMRFLIRS